MNRRYLTILFLLFVFHIQSQNSNHFFEHLTIENGLINSTVKAIHQDSLGFMWYGTKNGLCRFDGYTFKFFFHEQHNANSIPDNYIVSLTEYRNKIFIGTYSGGLSIYNLISEKFENISFIDDVFKKEYPISKVIQATSPNKFFISTLGGGLILLDLKTNSFERFGKESERQLTSNYISDIYLNKDKLFIATPGEQINIFNIVKDAISVISHSNTDRKMFLSFGNIFYATDSVLFVGTETEKLLAIDISDEQFVNIDYLNKQLPQSIITGIVNLNGKLVISTDGRGLYYYDPATLSVENVKHQLNNMFGLSTDAIWTMYVGRGDVLWIGTFAAGVNIYKEQKNIFQSYRNIGNSEYTLSNASVLDIECIGNDQVFIGTDGGGLNILNLKTGIFTHIFEKDGICSNVIKSIYEDKSGNIWLGSYAKGFCIYNNATEFKKLQEQLKQISIWDIIEDNRGNIWLGTLYQGLFVYNKNTQQVHNYKNNPNDKFSIAGDIVNVLYIDKDENLWIGTDGGGVSKYNYENNIFENFKKSDKSHSLVCNIIKTIFQDNDGQLYFGTQAGGINILHDANDNTFSVINKQDGLPSNTICDIIQDTLGNLWVSTDRGICKYNIKQNEIYNYDIQDGLQGLEFNYNTSSSDNEGRYYFGGLKGFVRFNPFGGKKSDYEITPLILDIRIDDKNISILSQNNDGGRIINKPVFLIDTLFLENDVSVFSFELGSDDFLFPMKNEYKYQLLGFDDTFKVTSSKNRIITYTNLPGGKYVFEYSVRNSGGEWNEVRRLFVNKHLLLSETLIFKVSLIVLVIIIVIGVIVSINYRNKVRERILEVKVRERTNIISTQKNEMEMQRDELANKHREIERQQEVLEESHEHMNIQNEELRTQSDLLKEVNDEVMEQNQKINEQAKILREKNTLLTKSLNYAKRIQTSLFPSEKELQTLLEKSFLFFKPKDIVSGDFFWMRKVDDFIVVAEVDCTGHGVPGAFMSMIGNALLNEIVVNKKILYPSDIFYQLNKETLDIFNLGDFDTEAQDEGMDLSLCVIDLKNNKLQFASAMQTIFILNGGEIDVFKGDIFSIGGLMSKYKDPVYNTFEYDIVPGLKLIFSSDGFIDQFGGDEKAKFGIERFDKLLLANGNKNIKDCHKSIEDTYYSWLGENDQLDDILIMGIEF